MTALFAEEIALAKLTLDITPYWRYLELSDMSDNPQPREPAEGDQRHRCCDIRPIHKPGRGRRRLLLRLAAPLAAAASSRVEQADGGLGHDCPIPPDAAASRWLPRGRQTGSLPRAAVSAHSETIGAGAEMPVTTRKRERRGSAAGSQTAQKRRSGLRLLSLSKSLAVWAVVTSDPSGWFSGWRRADSRLLCRLLA